MEAMSFGERKSRLIQRRADGSAPEWRGVGSVTILAPEFDRPLFLNGVGYTVFFKEDSRVGEFEGAVIVLDRLNRSPLGSILIWFVLTMLFGAALMRTWIHLH